MQRIVVLGAGPAGLGAAYQLSRRGIAEVTVVERAGVVGGLAGSFDVSGVTVDYGSHRLHPACAPDVLRDLQGLLGADLVLRERRGRIRLDGRWLAFPLRPLDLARNLSPRLAVGALSDRLRRVRAQRDGSFATVMERGVGRTLCDALYFPYARKVWGLDPMDISPVQATRRVAARSTAGLLRKAVASLPIVGDRRSRGFYYPRHGYGQISERLAQAAARLGARIVLNATIDQVRLPDDGGPASLTLTSAGETSVIEADHVLSTVPLGALVEILCPQAPDDVREAARSLRSRAMVLVYLTLATGRFSPFDTHYFPQMDVPFSRVSEPKNFHGEGPADRTVLCAELPTDVGSPTWNASDDDLGQAVVDGLASSGVRIRASVLDTRVVRLPNAYPIYERGFERAFDVVDRWVGGLERVVTFGRQGLFAHNNLHHVLEMAYAAADCLSADGSFDCARWGRFRTAFDQQVVVD